MEYIWSLIDWSKGSEYSIHAIVCDSDANLNQHKWVFKKESLERFDAKSINWELKVSQKNFGE